VRDGHGHSDGGISEGHRLDLRSSIENGFQIQKASKVLHLHESKRFSAGKRGTAIDV
jgi:hypothetical protein